MFAYLLIKACHTNLIQINPPYGECSILANASEDKVLVGFLTRKETRKRVRQILIGEGMTISAWLNGVCNELIAQHDQLQAHGAQKSRAHTVRDDWQDK
jgi:hypothetical protein